MGNAESFLPVLAAASPVAGPIVGGFMGYQAAGLESEQLKMAAERERLAARSQAVSIREELSRTIGAQRALMAARGINPDEGSGLLLQNRAARDAQLDLDLTQVNLGTALRGNALQRRQSSLAGRASLLQGFSQAAGNATSIAMSMGRAG